MVFMIQFIVNRSVSSYHDRTVFLYEPNISPVSIIEPASCEIHSCGCHSNRIIKIFDTGCRIAVEEVDSHSVSFRFCFCVLDNFLCVGKNLLRRGFFRHEYSVTCCHYSLASFVISSKYNVPFEIPIRYLICVASSSSSTVVASAFISASNSVPFLTMSS